MTNHNPATGEEIRAKAWATRRAKYGARGHSGFYARSTLERRALALIVRLHREGTLSEGQCCTALEIDRVRFRAICDFYPASTLRGGGEG